MMDAEHRELIEQAEWDANSVGFDDFAGAIRDCLTEIDRLREENERMKPLVQCCGRDHAHQTLHSGEEVKT